MEKTIGIFIPGRLQSERLPKKLALPLSGDKTLFSVASKKLGYLSRKYRCFALVNDDELIYTAERNGVEVVKRDVETCKVDGPLTYIFKEAIEFAEKNKLTHLMFLNPCLYNLSVETIEEAIEMFLNSNMDCATSVKEYKNWVWETSTRDMRTSIDYERLSTKEINGFVEAAHCFHIFNVQKFKETGSMLTDDLCLATVPKEQTLDVDDAIDLEVAKIMYAKNRLKYVVDIDGTVLQTNGLDYTSYKPIESSIDKLQKIDANGHHIQYFTARGTETGKDWRELTLRQLRESKAPQHMNLMMGKPAGDVYIDDKALNVRNWE